MRLTDRRRYDMLVRVKAFGAEHAAQFPASSVGGKLFVDLAAAVDQLTAQVSSEVQGHNTASDWAQSKAAARQKLRAALDAIDATARTMSLDMSGLEGKFHAPLGRNDHALVIAARQFVDAAGPLAAGFVAHGLPPTFVADLQAALEAFEQSAEDHLGGQNVHIAARASMTSAMKSANDVLQRLDTVVPNTLRANPGILALWNSARHVERVTRAAAGATAAKRQPNPRPAAAPAVPSGATAPDAVHSVTAVSAVSTSRA